MKLGGIYVDVGAKTTGLKRDLKKAEGIVKKSSDVMQKSFKYAGIAATALGAAMVYVGKQTIDMASDMEETQGKFDVVFRGMTETAEKWSKELVDSYAMSGVESKKFLSNIQDLIVPTGMAREAAGAMSNQFVKLAADLGSFNNLPTERVIQDIQSALAGSAETMLKYGINVKQAELRQEALNMGLVQGKEKLSAAAKVQAIYSIAMREGADAVGDMDRTMGSYANQQKKLSANIVDLKTQIGQGLLPAMTDVTTELNEWFKANGYLLGQDIAGWVGGIVTAVKGIATAWRVANSFTAWAIGEMLIAWENLTYQWELGVLNFQSVIFIAFDEILTMAGQVFEGMANGFALIGGADIAAELQETATSLYDASTATEQLQSATTRLYTAHVSNLDILREVQREQVLGIKTLTTGEREKKKAVENTTGAIKNQKVAIQETTSVVDAHAVAAIKAYEEIETSAKLSAFRTREALTESHIIALNLMAAGDDRYIDSFQKLQEIAAESAEDAANSSGDSWSSFYEELINGASLTTDSLSSLFGDFAAGVIVDGDDIGKSFKSMLKGMLSAFVSTVASMVAKWAAMKAVGYFTGTSYGSAGSGAGQASAGTGATVGSLVGGIGGAAAGAAAGTAVGSAIGTAVLPVVGTAVGAVVGGLVGGLFEQGGVPGGLSPYRNSVVNKPTIFPFANGGSIGLMGEAGSEAIMPLTRTSGGDLGVKAESSEKPVTVNVYIGKEKLNKLIDSIVVNRDNQGVIGRAYI